MPSNMSEKAHFWGLDYYEGYSNSYTRFQVSVNSKTGTYPDAWVYEVVNKSEFVPPSTL